MNSQEWLNRLIAYDTTSHHSNLPLIESLENWFTQHDIPYRLTYDDKRSKANLFATLAGNAGGTQGGIILSGHTDVVPVDGQKWRTNPFIATQVDDKIYGRGTADMKGFLAVILGLTSQLAAARLKHPVHFAFSFDEEVGCIGARRMISDFIGAGYTPEVCIVGEPTNMRPVVAHKGIQLFRCKVKGLSAHSSLTSSACNAIEYAANIVNYVRGLADDFRLHGPFDENYDVPYTSISTNMIGGGTANNIIPANCEFSFDCRYLPQVNPTNILGKVKAYIAETLLPKMQQEFPNATIEMTAAEGVPSFETGQQASLYDIASEVTGEKETLKVAYATEAGLFQAQGIQTLLCGPGSIEQAHRPNEYVTASQIELCEKYLMEMITAWDKR